MTLDSHLVAGLCWAGLLVVLLGRLGGALPRLTHKDRDAWLLVLLFVVGFVARLLLSVDGPGDRKVTQQWVFLEEEPDGFGPTPTALLRALFLVLPADDRTIFLLSQLFGALAPIVLFAAMRAWKTGRFAAHAAAWFLTIQPLALRFSGTANRQMIALFLAALILWAAAGLRSRRWKGWAVLLVTATILARGNRPESLRLMPGLVLLLVASTGLRGVWRGGSRRRETLRVLLVGSVSVGAAVTLWFVHPRPPGVVADVLHYLHLAWKPETHIWANGDYTALAFVPLLLWGAFEGLRRKETLVFWALLGLLLNGLSAPKGSPAHMEMDSARYQTTSMMYLAVLCGLGVGWLRGWLRTKGSPTLWRAVAAGLTVAIVATSVHPYRQVLPRTTLDEEYALLKRWFREAPPDAEIYYVHHAFGDAQMDKNAFIAPMVGRPDVRWLRFPQDWHPSDRPQLYYHGPGCWQAWPFWGGSGSEERGRIDRTGLYNCRVALEAYGDRPVEEVTLPARRQGKDVYVRLQLPIGLYEMDRDALPEAVLPADLPLPRRYESLNLGASEDNPDRVLP